MINTSRTSLPQQHGELLFYPSYNFWMNGTNEQME